MVSNIYTPLLRNIKPRGLVNNPNGQPTVPNSLPDINPDERRRSIYEPGTPGDKDYPVRIKGLSEQAQDNNPQDNPDNHMATLVEQQQRGKISIQTVLKDFYKTLQAVSPDPSVHKTIAPYLEVVSLQAQTDKPNMALMRENLKIAAKTLDTYITASLGQPSTVVKEWVDALLMQPIDFRQSNPLNAKENNTAPKLPASFTGVLETLDPEAIEPPKPNASFLLGEAKKAFQQKDWDTAKSRLLEASSLLDDNTPLPIQTHVFYGLGRLAQRENQNQDAQQYYQQAQNLLNSSDTQPLAMQQKIATSLGQVCFNIGNTARQDKKYQDALQAFKTAYSNAQSTQDTELQKQCIQQLAGLYLDVNKPEKAQEILLRL